MTANASAKPEGLPVGADYNLYAISPSGRWIAAARQNDLALVRIKDGRQFLHYPITPGGGHPESLGFVHGQGTAEDQALYGAWSANQIAAMGPAARRSAPSHQAAVWLIERLSWSDDPLSVPDLVQVRENSFGISFSKDRYLSLAVLDPKNPVQWLDAESQISFALGGFAGPGRLARFSPDNRRLLVVHDDGTARLWDLDGRTERRRFTSPNAIADAAFLQLPSSTDSPSIVTVDREGWVQVWSDTPDANAGANIR
jgi:WD40 repeat protein